MDRVQERTVFESLHLVKGEHHECLDKRTLFIKNKQTKNLCVALWVLMPCRRASLTAKASGHVPSTHSSSLYRKVCYEISAKWFMRLFWHSPAHPNHTHLLWQKEETTHRRITLRKKKIFIFVMKDIFIVKIRVSFQNVSMLCKTVTRKIKIRLIKVASLLLKVK